MVAPAVDREATNLRHPLSPRLKLAVALRHLATEDNLRLRNYAFGVEGPALRDSSKRLLSN